MPENDRSQLYVKNFSVLVDLLEDNESWKAMKSKETVVVYEIIWKLICT